MTTTKVSNGPSLECDRCHVCDSLEKALGEIHAAISPFVPEGVLVHTATWLAEQLSELQAMRGGRNPDNLISERDEWKRRAEVAEAKACSCGCNAMREGPTHMSGAVMALMAAAEWEDYSGHQTPPVADDEDRARFLRDPDVFSGRRGAFGDMLDAMAAAKASDSVTVNGVTFRAMRSSRPADEQGPGIKAVRPDNSVAHLDEDLLCEDV